MTTNTHISVRLTPEIRLEQALKEAGVENPASVGKLAVSGKMTIGDFGYIGKTMSSALQELDLGNASFENNTFPSPYYIPSGLTSIIIPQSVNKFNDSAFRYYSALTSITAPPDNPVYATENGVLFNKDKSELVRSPEGRQGDYIVPDSVVKIGKKAFFRCKSLGSVTIPDSVTEIGDGAFGCSSLISIIIPDSVTKISDWVFSDCNELISIVTHPNNPVYASKNNVLFSKDRVNFTICLTPELRLEQALKDAGIKYPASVTKLTITGTINDDDFNYIQTNMGVTLQEMDMGNALVENKNISPWTFRECTEMISIIIPASVERICIPYSLKEVNPAFNGCVAFSGCTALTDISVHPKNPVYASENGVLFCRDKTVLLLYPKGRQGDYVVPDSVTEIADEAFKGCAGLTSVTIPDSVIKIGYGAFDGCPAVITVHQDNPVFESENGKLMKKFIKF